MGKYELIHKVENSHLLVESQKKALIEMVEEEIRDDEVSILEVIDECLWKLFEIRITSLNAMEQVEITNVVKELGYDNN